MAIETVQAATLKCSFGSATSSLMVLPIRNVMAGGPLAANIMDHIPLVNIFPFGMCNSLANPAVAGATAAASGVLTSMPCVPFTPQPWVVGSITVLINNSPALNNSSKCMCTWGGVITIVKPGQLTVQVP